MIKQRLLFGVLVGVIGLYFIAGYMSNEKEVIQRDAVSENNTTGIMTDSAESAESEHQSVSLGGIEASLQVDVEEVLFLPETPWLSDPINQFSNDLYDFIELEKVRYVSTTDYPFDEQKKQQLRASIRAGEMIMFDHTEASYLNSYGVSEAQVVSEYFGTAAEGDIIVATAMILPDGGMHYLVLPLENEFPLDNASLLHDVKQAVTLLKGYKLKLVSPEVSEDTNNEGQDNSRLSLTTSTS